MYKQEKMEKEILLWEISILGYRPEGWMALK